MHRSRLPSSTSLSMGGHCVNIWVRRMIRASTVHARKGACTPTVRFHYLVDYICNECNELSSSKAESSVSLMTAPSQSVTESSWPVAGHATRSWLAGDGHRLVLIQTSAGHSGSTLALALSLSHIHMRNRILASLKQQLAASTSCTALQHACHWNTWPTCFNTCHPLCSAVLSQ
jgi:hypothetical protein